MTPEVQILLINAAALALAYGVVYPRLTPITMAKIAVADGVLTLGLLGIAAWLFWGAQLWLFGWYVGPVLFALITLMLIEAPVMAWFIQKHDIGF